MHECMRVTRTRTQPATHHGRTRCGATAHGRGGESWETHATRREYSTACILECACSSRSDIACGLSRSLARRSSHAAAGRGPAADDASPGHCARHGQSGADARVRQRRSGERSLGRAPRVLICMQRLVLHGRGAIRWPEGTQRAQATGHSRGISTGHTTTCDAARRGV